MPYLLLSVSLPQNPVEKVADVALDVLKLGAEGLVVMPARQIGKVFRWVGHPP
jgi:hypothetical protein